MLALFGLLLAVVIGLVVVGWVIGSVIGFVLMLLLAGLIGALASKVVGYRGGIVFSVGAGLLGAVLGTIIANIIGAPKLLTLWNLPVLWTVVGAFATVAVAKVVLPGDRGSLRGGNSGLLR